MATARGFLTLLLFQAAGASVKAVTHISFPGPLIGMALLALWLTVDKKRPYMGIHRAADKLLQWIGLLFVPAGVGALVYLPVMRAAWLPLTVGLAGSAFLTVGATAWVMQALRCKTWSGE